MLAHIETLVAGIDYHRVLKQVVLSQVVDDPADIPV